MRITDPLGTDQKQIFYSCGYKYQLRENYSIQIAIKPKEAIVTDYICLSTDGLLVFTKGYAWNGCSGPTYDDDTNMRGSLVHDGGYQLMRMGLLGQEWKAYFDLLFKAICLEDGMWSTRSDYYHWAVDKFGGPSCAEGAEPYPTLIAPK